MVSINLNTGLIQEQVNNYKLSVKSFVNYIFPCSNLGNVKYPGGIYFLTGIFFFPSPSFHYRNSPVEDPGLSEDSQAQVLNFTGDAELGHQLLTLLKPSVDYGSTFT